MDKWLNEVMKVANKNEYFCATINMVWLKTL